MPENLLEDPYVVHGHVLREFGRFVGVPWPLTAHGDVQNEEEGVVEGVVLAATHGLVNTEEFNIVQIPGNALLIPIDGKDMEFV